MSSDGSDIPFLELAASTLRQAEAQFPLSRPVSIEWRPYRVTAGMAYFKGYRIGLGATVLKTPEAVVNTVLHEFAHLLAYDRFGRKAANHGPAWQAAMKDLGVKPVVRHRYEVVRNTARQEVGYLCLGCGKTILRSRRLPQRRRYVHADCGGDLKLSFVRAKAPEPVH